MQNNKFVKSDFNENQERRKERFEELADKNDQRSNDYHERSRQAVEHIPFGQPILVGHHSEKRHRRDIERARSNADKAVEASRKSDYYEQRAKTVGRSGIASDDPEALAKLKDKLSRLVDWQETMKKTNREFKKGGWDAVTALNKNDLEKIKDSFERMGHYTKPFESYSLTNNNARIRTTKQRIKELETLHNSEPLEFENDEFKMFIEDGRIVIEFFEGKPSDECRSLVKKSAFRWSRYNSWWQRKVTGNALRDSEFLLKNLQNLETCY